MFTQVSGDPPFFSFLFLPFLLSRFSFALVSFSWFYFCAFLGFVDWTIGLLNFMLETWNIDPWSSNFALFLFCFCFGQSRIRDKLPSKSLTRPQTLIFLSLSFYLPFSIKHRGIKGKMVTWSESPILKPQKAITLPKTLKNTFLMHVLVISRSHAYRRSFAYSFA